MDRKIFHRLFEERIVMLDGATGSNLMQAGMPVGVCRRNGFWSILST